MTTAIYAGSFDIVTVGHINIIEKACNMFKEVDILIASNPNKKYMFTPKERLEMINEIEDLNFCVNIWNNDLVINYANGFCKNPVLIRGIRNTTDMLEEMKLADINKEIGGVDTIFIPCSNEYRNVSSSLVKELIKYNKDISKYVPKHVEKAIRRKINE